MKILTKHFKLLITVIAVCFISNSSSLFGQNLLCNGGFDDTLYANGVNLLNAALVPCWETSSILTTIELWNNTLDPTPFSGQQFVEINAYGHDTLYQDFTVSAGSLLHISFAHRGRLGTDVMGVQIGPVDGPYTDLGQFADSTDAWGYHSVDYTVPSDAATSNYRLRLYSFSIANEMAVSFGNFLDSVTVTAVTTSISENHANSIALYPNPATDLVTIGNVESGSVVTITDITGRIMYSTVTDNTQAIIDTDAFAGGMYIVRIEHNGAILSRKLVIAD